MDENPIILGLEFQARSLCSLQSESEAVKFFAATQTLKPGNQIHCIELSEEPGTYKDQVFKHDLGEVWKLNSSPSDKNLLASVYSSYRDTQLQMGTALLRIPDEIEPDSKEYLTFAEVNVLKCEGTEIKTTEFNPVEPKLMATVVDGRLLLNDLETGGKCVAEVQNKGAPKFSGGKWSQHSAANQFICLHDGAVRSFDIREASSVAWSIEDAHGQQLVRDLDCNPNKQCHLVTGGDDGSIRVWDYRSVKQPIFVRSDHNHWVFSVRFNTFHDSLILSSSSDGKVVLSCARSVSSEADDNGKEDKEGLSDGLLQIFDSHEDSVYSAEWSTADPWIFASLSYDGRVVISQVPKQYKYQLLM